MNELDRRSFLKRAGGVGLGGLAAGYGLGTATAGTARAEESPEAMAQRVNAVELSTRRGFDGVHQAGILTPAADFSMLVALDSIADSGAELALALQALSSRARELTRGGQTVVSELDAPPFDSGTLGTVIAPDGLTVTIAFGASMFDGRYGLAPRRPAHLTEMRAFPNDDLDPGADRRRPADPACRRPPGHRRPRDPRAAQTGARPARAALDRGRVPGRPARPLPAQLAPQPLRLP